MEAKEKQAYFVVTSDQNFIGILPVPDPNFFDTCNINIGLYVGENLKLEVSFLHCAELIKG